ncbi:COP9 signalosome complex subunit 4-like [Brevipalpus obovatus]|uniref:COP9 signalosome complex subunit 4-like n=1 Tax=Brevipalpus obovatus TaxID=246614 RepID=UPI003D9E0177
MGSFKDISPTINVYCSMFPSKVRSTGQQRSRMLATLFKDERCQQLPCFNILEKMYFERIIKRSEMDQFNDMLAKC